VDIQSGRQIQTQKYRQRETDRTKIEADRLTDKSMHRRTDKWTDN
jgi:hypothetical protein